MKIAPLPSNEAERLESLYHYEILDTEIEQDFEDVVQLASRICKVPISLISLVDAHRQWFKARVGIPERETPRAPAFCTHAILQEEIMIVPDATKDERFFDNPFVTGALHLRFYAGMPLTMDDGLRLGTLCIIDREPRQLSEEEKYCLRTLGKQVVNLLKLRLNIKELEAALNIVGEQKFELQKLNQAGNRLLSVIGHDVRSPLANLGTLLEMFSLQELTPEEFRDLLRRIRINTASAGELLDDLLEWAEDQFSGRKLSFEVLSLAPMVDQLILDHQPALERKSNRAINQVAPDFTLHADRRALVFMLRNLLLNANKFTENGTIHFRAERRGATTRIEIVDSGIGMSAVQLDKLFDPTSHSSTLGTKGEKGSGIGLQLCREFARRHRGTIEATSEPGKGSRFTIEIGAAPIEAKAESGMVA